jgi:hypothetical protein
MLLASKGWMRPMRSWSLLAILAVLLAGCADDSPASSTEMTLEPSLVEATTEEMRTVEAPWVAWAGTCQPVEAGGNLGVADPVEFGAPENLTSLRVEVTWDASNPTVEAMRIYLFDGDDPLGMAEGPSPLVLEPDGETASGVSGRVTLYLEPARCATPLGSAGTALTGQAVEARATFKHLVPLDSTGRNGIA